MRENSTNFYILRTRNTEYHLKGSLVVAVKNRNGGTWLQQHRFLGQEVKGILNFPKDGYLPTDTPQVGSVLWFVLGGRDFLTTAIAEIDHPSVADLGYYVAAPKPRPQAAIRTVSGIY